MFETLLIGSLLLAAPGGPTPPTAPTAGVPAAPTAAPPRAPAEAAEDPRATAPTRRGTARGTARGRAAGSRAERREPAATIPPSLTTAALRGELLRSEAGETPEERAPAMTERARLEQLAADIARAREELRKETARLESMLRTGDAGGGEAGAGAVGSPGAGPGSRALIKEQVDTVSRAMKGMKPEQAAGIMSRLDRLLAAEILRRMRAQDAGLVMAQLKPDLAADLATIIATRRPATGEPAPRAEVKK